MEILLRFLIGIYINGKYTDNLRTIARSESPKHFMRVSSQIPSHPPTIKFPSGFSQTLCGAGEGPLSVRPSVRPSNFTRACPHLDSALF